MSQGGVLQDKTLAPGDVQNVFVGQSSNDSDSGLLRTVVGGDTTVLLSNRATAQVQTTTDAQTNLLFFNLGGDPAGYFVEVIVVGYNETDDLTASYAFRGSMRTDGTDAFEIANETTAEFAEGAMSTAEVTMVTLGNDVAVYVTPVGLDTKTINWNTLLTYRTVGVS